MPLIASNVVIVPPPIKPEPKEQSIVVGGSNWRDQLSKQIEQRVVDLPPKEEAVVTTHRQIIVGGGNWRDQLNKQIELNEPLEVIAVAVEPPDVPKPKKSRKKSEKLIEYKESSFMSDMLSINKE